VIRTRPVRRPVRQAGRASGRRFRTGPNGPWWRLRRRRACSPWPKAWPRRPHRVAWRYDPGEVHAQVAIMSW